MKIPSFKYLRQKAGRRLDAANDSKKIILIYSAISAASSFLVNAVRYGVSGRISQTGGLANIGARSMLSTLNTVLPILEFALMLALGLGYTAAVLRIARRQYASPKTLKAGAERFWVLLRANLLQGMIYIGLGVALTYASITVFLMTPLANGFMEVAAPLLASGGYTPEMLLMNDALVDQMMAALTPMFLLSVLIYAPFALFVFYRYRFVDYILIDEPGMGAIYAMRKSRFLMRKNGFAMFKLDLGFWWYYLLRFLATGLLYLELILSIFGIFLPVSETMTFFGTVVLYLAADFALNYYFMNYVEVTYALAYDSLIPKQEPNSGMVLGNIFQNM